MQLDERCRSWMTSGPLAGRVPALFLMAALAVPLAACQAEEPVDPDLLAGVTALRVGELLATVQKSAAFTEPQDSTVRKMAARVDAPDVVLAEVGPVATVLRAVPPLAPLLDPGRVMRSRQAAKFETPVFEQASLDVRVLLSERLLTAANLESQNGNQATFRLRPDPTCRPVAPQQAPLDAGCVASLQAHPVWVVMKPTRAGVRLSWLFSQQRLDLMAVEVGPDSMAIELDLANIQTADEMVRGLAATPMDVAEEVAWSGGRLRLVLERLGERQIRFAIHLLTGLELVAREAGQPLWSLSTAAMVDPLVALTIDGDSETAALDTNLGPTTLRLPWDPTDSGDAALDLQLHMSGVSARTHLQEQTERVRVMGLGFGEGKSGVSVRDQEVVSFALNPAHGRRLDLTMQAVGTEDISVMVAPALDVQIGFDLRPLIQDFGDDPPRPELLSESYRLLLEGAMPAVFETVGGADGQGGNAGQRVLKVVAGLLSFSTGSGSSVSVPAGSCLLKDAVTEGEHAVVGGLIAGACR